jgi:predicted TPR repeat methyltransferase
MVRSLGYRLPQQVAEKLLHAHPDKKLNVLDLGCGTGLLGACLGRLDGALVGVDVSREMITQAVKHDVYDKFHTVNVHDALDATPESLYDVIAALDVFIYAGDVSKAIPDAHRILVPGGTLVASFETAPEDGENLVLLLSGRYSHKRSHVANMCEMAGFAKVDIEDTVLRLENGEPVNGFVVWATKATAKPAKAPRSPRAAKAPSVKASV